MRAPLIPLIVVTIVSIAWPGVAAAQTEGRGPASSRVEIGAEAEAVSLLLGYGAHLSLGVSTNHSVELTATALTYTPFESDGRFFVGQAQWRGAFNRRPGRLLFVTVGGTVTLQYEHPPEYRFTRPDGSVFVSPETRSWRIDGPVGFHIGVGGQHALHGRTAIRWDAQMILHVREGVVPVGRATFGVVRLLGRAQ